MSDSGTSKYSTKTATMFIWETQNESKRRASAMGDRQRQFHSEVTLLLPPSPTVELPPKDVEPVASISRRRAASVTAFFLVAACSLLLLLSQSPTFRRAIGEDGLNAPSYANQRFDPDQDSQAATLLIYGGGRVSQRIENHSLASLSTTANEDGLLEQTVKQGINTTDKVVSAARNQTKQQQKTKESSPATFINSSSKTDETSKASSSTIDGTTKTKSQNMGRPIFGTPIVGYSHIIFVETSCPFNDTPQRAPYDSESGLRLSPRAACAVEAAARTNPDRLIYLLHTCPVRWPALRPGGAPAYALAALSLPNVRLWEQPYIQEFAGSPLELWLATGALRKSLYPIHHAADVLRFVVLWKYGGTYLDTDVLMIRSLSETRDFGCAESEQQVSIGAMDMSHHNAGHRLAELCLDEERINFDPRLWGHNGPGAITRAMERMCGVEKVSDMTADRCGGYKLLPTSAFYPIDYNSWRRYFQEEDAEKTLADVRDSIGVHVWNALSHDEPVYTNSKQPYAQIARQVCPSVVAALNGTM